MFEFEIESFPLGESYFNEILYNEYSGRLMTLLIRNTSVAEVQHLVQVQHLLIITVYKNSTFFHH